MGSGKFIESNLPKIIHRKQLIERDIYRAESSSNGKFIERKIYRTENLSNGKLTEQQLTEWKIDRTENMFLF